MKPCQVLQIITWIGAEVLYSENQVCVLLFTDHLVKLVKGQEEKGKDGKAK
jgi:hypothetical protein